MHNQDTLQKDKQPSLIEDLTVNNKQAEEVKGGGQVGTVKYEEMRLTDIMR